MKRKISIIISVVFAFVFIFNIMAFAALPETDSIMNNNTLSTNTSFVISNTGNASVTVSYTGYSNITTGAEISVVIKKNTFLWFTSTVVDETYNIVGENYSHTYYYDLTSSGSGTYKCYVTYTVSGSGGPDDVIPFEKTASY